MEEMIVFNFTGLSFENYSEIFQFFDQEASSSVHVMALHFDGSILFSILAGV